MPRKRKPESEQLVNVGLKVSLETKQFLLDEVAATGVAEGTLARRYMLLGIGAAQQKGAASNPTVARIVELLNGCSARTQLDVLAIVQALKTRQEKTADHGRPPIDESEIGQELEFIGRIGQG